MAFLSLSAASVSASFYKRFVAGDKLSEVAVRCRILADICLGIIALYRRVSFFFYGRVILGFSPDPIFLELSETFSLSLSIMELLELKRGRF